MHNKSYQKLKNLVWCHFCWNEKKETPIIHKQNVYLQTMPQMSLTTKHRVSPKEVTDDSGSWLKSPASPTIASSEREKILSSEDLSTTSSSFMNCTVESSNCIQVIYTVNYTVGTEAEIQLPLKRSSRFQRLFPNPSWLVWGRASRHQKLAPTFTGIDSCLMVTKRDFLEMEASLWLKREVPKCC